MYKSVARDPKVIAPCLVEGLLPGAKYLGLNQETWAQNEVRFTDPKGRIWFYVWNCASDEQAEAWIETENPDEEASDPDSDWEAWEHVNFYSGLMALLLDIREGKV